MPYPGTSEPQRVVKTLRPMQPGTLKLVQRYGDALVCVRYREDAQRTTRYTTVELIIQASPVQRRGKDKQWVDVKIEWRESTLRARAKSLGADHGINYTTHPDWDKEVRRLTGGHGADIIVEVGGTGTIEKSLSAAAIGGGIAVIGILSGVQSQISLFQVLAKQVRLHGVYVGSRQHLADLTQAITANAIKPVIDKVFPFAEARDAFAYQASNKHFGKIVIAHDMAGS